jgi:hypothetical protein
LEARWAVFFDSLGVPYEYEKEGFDLDGTPYLPDFWLPRQDTWIEIKGEPPTDEEQRLGSLLADATGKRVLLFFGSIEHNARDGSSESAFLLGPEGWDNFYRWCECAECHTLDIQYSGAANRNCSCVDDPGGDSGYDIPWPADGGKIYPSSHSPRLRAAFARAQGARFEHGETP